jgi:protocatechuate 3,4-dioxygenase beta subunit
MDNDDKPIGRVLSRREVLILIGVSGASVLAGCTVAQPQSGVAAATATTAPAATATATLAAVAVAAPAATTAATEAPMLATEELSCVVRPEMTEGPYFVDVQLDRSDIRSDPTDGSIREGVPLELVFYVAQVNGAACTPLAGAMVDVWHCDAQGVYSAVSGAGGDTSNQKFLRGYQVTDASGKAQFTTIYPGWYTGRTVHIHFKVRTTAADGQSYEFTSQLYMDDALSDEIFSRAPYLRSGSRDTTNATDMHYANGGDQLLLALAPAGEGYTTTFALGLDLADSDAGASDSFSTGGGDGRPGTP